MTRVVHLIGSLERGGAETVLYRLLAAGAHADFEPHVVTLRSGGELESKIRALGVPIDCVNLRGLASGKGFARLVRSFQSAAPEVIVTWMYHANLIGSLAARRAGQVPLIWNIRHGGFDRPAMKRTTRLVSWIGAMKSSTWPDRIAYVSQAACEHHHRLGYCPEKATVVPNGFDTRRFRPNPLAATEIRSELGVPVDARLIGLVARFHPEKDHKTFIDAAAEIRRYDSQSYFVLCGQGISWQNGELAQRIRQHGLQNAFRLLGPRDDIDRIHPAVDVVVCCSRSEAFPNVIGEAMACQVPCVVTDVGDCPTIVGDTGVVVPVGKPMALARACINLLALPADQRHALGERARQRIVTRYSLRQMVEAHQQLWKSVAHRQGQPAVNDSIRRAA
jgi:glycosyltransferase involved in cell wall biosynthesis